MQKKLSKCVVCLGSVWDGVKCCQPCRRVLTEEQKFSLGINRGKTVRDCAYCGVAVWMRPSAKFCSQKCYQRGQRVYWTCKMCGASYRPRNANYRFCSRSCSYEHASLNKRSSFCKVWFPTCSQCGSVFAARSSNAKKCSYRCRAAAESVRICDLYAMACQVGAAGSRWRVLLYGYLRERDGDYCQCGCRKKIRFDLKSGPNGHPSGMGPSADHILPRSQGGSDDPANLRLLTWKCNHLRGNRGGNEQLMLIG